MAIHELSALELARVLRDGDVSAAEVNQETQGRIVTVGAQVGAFAHTAEDLAARQAAEADRTLVAWRADGSPGGPDAPPPFLGVPVPIKDLNQVAGIPFEAGSAVMRGTTAQVDDGVVTLLRNAGTIMVGKTTTPEFGFPPYTEPATAPAARTPWCLSRTAGGSSGGAGAAVAAGVVPVAHGSDGGGSLRIPAAACGVVGLKPSRGRVSPGPYGAESVGLSTNGVITRTVRDSAAFLDVLSQPWPGDSWVAPPEEGGFLAACDREPGRLRIGFLLEPLNCDEIDLHPEARAAAEKAARLLEEAGHVVEDAPRPMNGADWMTFMPLWSTFAAQIPLPEGGEEGLVPLTRWLREMGQRFTAADFANAVVGAQELARRLTAAWERFDVILTPTLSAPPLPPAELQLADPAADFEAQKRFTPWTSVWNMLGSPSISVPIHVGWVADPQAAGGGMHLPFGAMLGAVRPGTEAMLLQLAAHMEEAEPWLPRLGPVMRRFQI
nr:amidase [Actinomycetales bacterium]